MMESNFYGINGTLIAPDGTRYELNEVTMRVTTEYFEVVEKPGVISYVKLKTMNFDFTGGSKDGCKDR